MADGDDVGVADGWGSVGEDDGAMVGGVLGFEVVGDIVGAKLGLEVGTSSEKSFSIPGCLFE